MFDNNTDKIRILHFLNKDIKSIMADIPDIANQEFNAIQISSVQPFKDENLQNYEWCFVYQPLDFSIGNVLGTKNDLINLCTIAKQYNIRIIVDVVCNHMANMNDINPLVPSDKVNSILLNNPYFWKERKMVNNWNNRNQVVHYCMGLPGLELANYDLQDIVLTFLRELADCGVGGFRFDAAKSIALPYPDDYSNEYPDCHFWTRVVKDGLAEYDLFNYSEVIFADNELINKYQKYTNVLTNQVIPEIPDIISVMETHDTFLNNGDMGWTKDKSIEEAIELYSDLTKESNRTIFFNRPNSEMWKLDIIRECNHVDSKSINKIKIKTSI